MKLSDYKGGEGRYLKAADIPEGKELRVVIDRIVTEIIERDDGGKTDKAVCYFSGKEKGLVLNATNCDVLISAFGDSTEAIAGQTVLLYRTTTAFKGKTVPCLRLRVPAQEVDEEQVAF